MKKFWGWASNDKFSIGCTGQTVYLYDKSGNELAKFKDITYGYTPMISPDGTLFVVKSTEGRLAVYSLETLSLIKKFRFSKVDGAQDDGFCFSPDGEMFFNVERQKDDLHSAISIYDTTDFSLSNQILLGEDMMLDHIEFDKATNTYYVLGFMRDANRVYDYEFVAEFKEWYDAGWVTTKSLYGGYTSTLFTTTDKQCSFMTIGSSAGASHQKPSDGRFEVDIAPIPSPSNFSLPPMQSNNPHCCRYQNSRAYIRKATYMRR